MKKLFFSVHSGISFGILLLGSILSAVAATYPNMIPCEKTPKNMACIAGGPFLRGANDGPPHARPQSTVWLQTFYMDKYEVTYGEYTACVKAGKCRRAGPNYSDFDNPMQPINGINWFDAENYCRIKGKHLPTEAEWEKAARGTDGRRFPWGDGPADCKYMVFKNEKGRSCGVPKAGKHPEKGRPEPVGSKPPNQYGIYDMAGNAYEWVADWYTKSYAKCGDACNGIDPKGPCDGKEKCPNTLHRRVVRGGSWYWGEERATTFYRRSHTPENKPFHHFGFRCAATVGEARKIRSQ